MQLKIDTHQDLLDFAIDLAKQAGSISKKAFSEPKRVENKNSAQDLVTETDRSVERFIAQKIKEKYPDHDFVGEETNKSGNNIPNGSTWIVDPIDGTTNFVHGIPYFCVAIGFCVERQPVLGVVYNPITEELFSAVKGKGAFLNGKEIKLINPCDDLSKGVIIMEFIAKDTAKKTSDEAVKIMKFAHGIRMHGSAALNLCYAACNRSDGFIEKGIKCWDICAAVVILREAGGYVTDYEGNEDFDICKGEVIGVATKKLASQIIEVLKGN